MAGLERRQHPPPKAAVVDDRRNPPQAAIAVSTEHLGDLQVKIEAQVTAPDTYDPITKGQVVAYTDMAAMPRSHRRWWNGMERLSSAGGSGPPTEGGDPMGKRFVAVAAAAASAVVGAGVASTPAAAITSALIDARSVSLAELKSSADPAVVSAVSRIRDRIVSQDLTEGNGQPQRDGLFG